MTTAVRTQWCWRCRSDGPGAHYADGSFDQWSVDVPEEWVDWAIMHSNESKAVRLRWSESVRKRLAIRWNIAFGIHCHTYEFHS